MIRKKQAITLVTIIVISFLVGGTFSFVTMAKDGGGNPFDKIWEKIYALEDRLDSIGGGDMAGFMDSPAYDSGWVSVGAGGELVFTHNLGTTEVFVYITGKDVDDTLGIHQYEYGGVGWAYWHNLDATNINVTAYPPWDHVRIMLWKIQESPT
jgi:hypothetical protein